MTEGVSISTNTEIDLSLGGVVSATAWTTAFMDVSASKTLTVKGMSLTMTADSDYSVFDGPVFNLGSGSVLELDYVTVRGS